MCLGAAILAEMDHHDFLPFLIHDVHRGILGKEVAGEHKDVLAGYAGFLRDLIDPGP
jgi:hypothetical protein